MPFAAAVSISQWRDVCAICGLRYAVSLEKAQLPTQALGLVRTLWAFTAIFTLVAELPLSCCLASFAVCTSWPWAGPCRTLTSLLPRPCAGHLCPLCLALSWPNCVLCFRPCAGLTAWFPRSWAGLEVLGLWPRAGRTAASCPGLMLALGELCDQDRAQYFEFDSLVIDFLCLAWIATIASAFDYVRWNWICEHSCLGYHNHQGLLHPCVQWRSFRL